MMTLLPSRHFSGWARLPTALRAIISGLLMALIPANVWPLLLLNLGVPLAAVVEVAFLALYVWWASGGGPPRRTQAALFFAVNIHASIVLLFRIVPYPMATFRQGYDFSFIPSLPLKWIAVVVSATSAGICEETGFRGYMQRPLELRHGAPVAVLISSLFFTAVHLTKGWAMAGMVPIVFGAGVLLGLLAWSSGSLIFGMIGHVMMDIGLFAYWWTGVAGNFTAKPISETGVDQPFLIACAVLATSLLIVLLSILKLRRKTPSTARS